MKKKILIVAGLVLTILIIIVIVHLSTRPKAYIAFVIDDWGYNNRYTDIVAEIDRPLTIAILPNLRYSRYVAEEVKKDNSIHDVILHLPLESKTDLAPETDTIRTSMEEDEMLEILGKDIKNIPGIVGISNHQGSKATEDKRVMGTVFKRLKEEDLFFLDSLTTPHSICLEAARKVGIRYVKRDVFLDITDETDSENFEGYIKKQIQELADTALKNGKAVGIGHNIEATLNAIKDSIPKIEKRRIKIVPLKKPVR